MKPRALLAALIPLSLAWPTAAKTPSEAHPEEPNWPTKSHHYVTHSVDKLARWLDNFFASDNYQTEAAEAFLRLRLTQVFKQGQVPTQDLAARGNLRLPALNKRLALILYDEDDNQVQQQTTAADTEEDTSVALQYTDVDENRHRLDYRLGLRSSGAIRTEARYRYRHQINDELQLQVTNQLRFLTDDGVDNQLQITVDKALSSTQIWRLNQRWRYGELTRGVEWRGSSSITQQFDRDQALSYFINAATVGRPKVTLSEHSLGINYRQRLWHKGLFIELQPAYIAERNAQTDKWNNGWQGLVRLELTFD